MSDTHTIERIRSIKDGGSFMLEQVRECLNEYATEAEKEVV